jgi:transposase
MPHSAPISAPTPLAALPALGIDVAKDTLDVCLLQDARALHQRFANTSDGHAQMLAWLAAQGVAHVQIALEATGAYSLAVAAAGHLAGHRVAVLNPRRVLDFARCLGRRNKTDRADAQIIARFAATQPLELWQPLPPAQALLRELLRRQADLEVALQAETRRLETAPAAPALRQSLRRAQRWLTAELTRLEKAILAHLAESSQLSNDIARLEAIPGIGQKSARLLAAEIPRHFKNARAVAAWLGVVPRQCQSGTSVRKASRIGQAAPELRSKLYFPALTAMRHDPRSRAFAERLRAAGKTPMAIVFAVLHKLVRTAFALLKSSADYHPDHSLFSTT